MVVVSFSAVGGSSERDPTTGQVYEAGQQRPYRVNVPENASPSTLLEVYGPNQQVAYRMRYQDILGEYGSQIAGGNVAERGFAYQAGQALTPEFYPGLTGGQAAEMRLAEVQAEVRAGSAGTGSQQFQMAFAQARREGRDVEFIREMSEKGVIPYGSQLYAGRGQGLEVYQTVYQPEQSSGTTAYWGFPQQRDFSVAYPVGEQPKQQSQEATTRFGKAQQRDFSVSYLSTPESERELWSGRLTEKISRFEKQYPNNFPLEEPVFLQATKEQSALQKEIDLYNAPIFEERRKNQPTFYPAETRFEGTPIESALSYEEAFVYPKQFAEPTRKAFEDVGFVVGKGIKQISGGIDVFSMMFPKKEQAEKARDILERRALFGTTTEELLGSGLTYAGTGSVGTAAFLLGSKRKEFGFNLALLGAGAVVGKGIGSFKQVKTVGVPEYFPKAKTNVSLTGIDSDLVTINLTRTGKGLLETTKSQRLFWGLGKEKLFVERTPPLEYSLEGEFVVKADKPVALQTIAGVEFEKASKPIQDFVLEQLTPQNIVSKKMQAKFFVEGQKTRIFDVSGEAGFLPKDLIKQEMTNVFDFKGKKLMSFFGEPTEFGEKLVKTDIGLYPTESFRLQGNWETGLQPELSVAKTNLTGSGSFSSVAQEMRPSLIYKLSGGVFGKEFKPKGKPSKVVGEYGAGINERALTSSKKGFDFFSRAKSFITTKVFEEPRIVKGKLKQKQLLDIAEFDIGTTTTAKDLVIGKGENVFLTKKGLESERIKLANARQVASQMSNSMQNDVLKFGEKKSLSEWAKETYGEKEKTIGVSAGKKEMLQLQREKQSEKAGILAAIKGQGTQAIAGPISKIAAEQEKAFSYNIPGSMASLAEGLTRQKTRLVNENKGYTSFGELPKEFYLSPQKTARQQMTPMQEQELKSFNISQEKFQQRFRTGQQFKSMQEQFQKSVSKQSQGNVVKSLQSQFQKEFSKQAQKQLEKQFSKAGVQSLTKQQSLLKQQNKQLLLSKQMQLTLTKQLQGQLGLQQQIQLQIKTPKPPRVPVWLPTNPQQFPKYSVRSFGGGFQAEVKRWGKWFRVSGSLPKERAFSLGSAVAESTAARSFRVTPFSVKTPFLKVPKNLQLPSMEQFYLGKKGQFVEKSLFAISTGGEKQEITYAPRKNKLLNNLFSFVKKKKSRRR